MIMENIKMQLSSQELKEYNKLREDGKQWYSYLREEGLTHKQAFTEAKNLSGINEDVETITCDGIVFSKIEFDEYQKLSQTDKIDYKHYRLSRNMSHVHALLISKSTSEITKVWDGNNSGAVDTDSILNKALEWLKQECRSAYNLIKDTIAQWWDKLKSWLAEVF
jgi:hypothetical protein